MFTLNTAQSRLLAAAAVLGAGALLFLSFDKDAALTQKIVTSSVGIEAQAETVVPSRNDVRLLTRTEVRTQGSYHAVEELCVGSNLYVFVDAYKAGGLVDKGESVRCK